MVFLGLLIIGSLLAAAEKYRFTPKPDKVDGVETPFLPLEGPWKFHPAPPQGFWTLNEKNAAAWSDIRVPGDWTMQGLAVKPWTPAGFLKTVDIPKSWAGKRIWLRFDSVQSDAKVWLNGRPAGSHQGGFNAFELDITALCKPGGANTIALAIQNESPADDLASGTQYAAYQFGGITRKAYLMAIPAVHVSALRIFTNLEARNRGARLRIDLAMTNNDRKASREATVTLALADPSGRSVPLADNAASAWDIAPGTTVEKTWGAPIPEPLLWDAEHPHLYTLTVSLKSDGRPVETIVRKVGFREIVVAGTQVFVNGSPIKVRGINRHETHPLLGRSLTPESSRRDAEIFQSANINYIRTSHYPPTEEFLDACDELGLYVECEAPLVWIGHAANAKWKTDVPQDPKYYPLIERAVGEMIAFHDRHPSIIFWSLANESTWGPNWAKAKKAADRLDPTRPKTFHDQAYGGYNNFGSTALSVANFHYPGPQGPELALDFARPLLYGEYCHLNTYNRTEIAADPGVRDAYGRGLHRQWERMFGSPTVIGGAIWSGIDDVFYLPTGKAVGYGEWGPIDGWRREKPEYWHVKKTYSPIRVRPETLPFPAPGEPLRLQVENRHDFADLNELRLEWRIGEAKATTSMDLGPRKSGVLTILPPAGTSAGQSLHLEFWSPRGFLVDAYEIALGGKTDPAPPFGYPKAGPMELRDEGTRFVAAGNAFQWAVDKTTGLILEAKAAGIPFISGGPALMLLAQSTGPCVTDFSLDVKPFNDIAAGWKAEKVEARRDGGAVVITAKGRFDEAEGGYQIRFDGAGRAEFQYEFAVGAKINPRQWGLVLYLPREYDTLRWSRRGLWSVYPDNHIGRLLGTAKALTEGRGFQFRVQPAWDWKDDQNELGSNDFRSTKSELMWAALTSDKGYGLLVTSAGKQAARSFVDKDRIGWLIADFNTGGGDLFFAPHHKADDRPLEKGEVIKGGFAVRLITSAR